MSSYTKVAHVGWELSSSSPTKTYEELSAFRNKVNASIKYITEHRCGIKDIQYSSAYVAINGSMLFTALIVYETLEDYREDELFVPGNSKQSAVKVSD